MSDLPFYLTLDGDNIIKNEEIKDFIATNPELKRYFQDYKIELRLLRISNLHSFCSWIISQQISSNAANKILNRFLNEVRPLTEENVLTYSDRSFQDLGLSRSKSKYIKNIARFFIDGKDIHDPANYSSKQLREFYTKIEGIGDWTVNMHLIFVLGRKDIQAVKDLVVRKGIQKMYSLDSLPDEKTARQITQNWGDLATIGTLLAWEIVENE